MKAGSFFGSSLATFVLAIAGCSQSVSTEVVSTSSIRPLVFYDETGRPSETTPALSKAKLDRIVEKIATQTSESIWFIRVKPSEGDRHGVIVYLAPERQAPRIREGGAYNIWVVGQEMGISPSWKYIQISGPGRTFTTRLTLPSASELPFKREDANLPEEELIRISDFVRQPSNYETSALQQTPVPETKIMLRHARELPIRSIQGADTQIHVDFGYLHGPLWGYGINLELERTPTGYRLKEWSFWIS